MACGRVTKELEFASETFVTSAGEGCFTVVRTILSVDNSTNSAWRLVHVYHQATKHLWREEGREADILFYGGKWEDMGLREGMEFTLRCTCCPPPVYCVSSDWSLTSLLVGTQPHT